MDIMKKTKIEQYLQGPLWALLILAFVDIGEPRGTGHPAAAGEGRRTGRLDDRRAA